MTADPLLLQAQMWFMHDSAPSHFDIIESYHLHNNYRNRWICRGDRFLFMGTQKTAGLFPPSTLFLCS